jgi:hypothetical protein
MNRLAAASPRCRPLSVQSMTPRGANKVSAVLGPRLSVVLRGRVVARVLCTLPTEVSCQPRLMEFPDYRVVLVDPDAFERHRQFV